MNLGKESEQLEFKESTSEIEEALIDITAILNKHSLGTLYFGVKNNGDPCGMPIGKNTIRDVSRKIYERIKPQLYPIITEENYGGLSCIKVSFEGHSRPYSCSGKYYKRVSDESRELSPQELADLFLNENYKKWETLCSDSLIDDVDEVQLYNFLEKAISVKRVQSIPYNKLELLSKLNLIYEDKIHLNNAGKILFSSHKPIQLKMAVFATNEKRTFLDISTSEGNIFELLSIAESYLKTHLNWKAEIKNFDRIETPEIPITALREILINSFAHANYLGSSRHEICIHPDRIAIYNPGSFPDNLKPEDFVNKNLSSKIRNNIICNVLYKCNAIESWSTGFKKVFSLCKKENVKLDYEKENDGFWFFFIRNSSCNSSISSSTKKLTELEKIILNEINKNPAITRENLSLMFGRTIRQIQRVLISLKNKKVIERIGSNKNGKWKIIS